MIHFNINGQNLSLSSPVVVSDSVNFLSADFNFSGEWNGLDKFVHFSKDEIVYDVQLENDSITPNMGVNLAEGFYSVYVHGSKFYNDELLKRITTNSVKLKVEKSGLLDGEPFPFTPASVGEKIVEYSKRYANDSKRYSEEAKETVENISESISESIYDEKEKAIKEIEQKVESFGYEERLKSLEDSSLNLNNEVEKRVEKDYKKIIDITTTENSAKIQFSIPKGTKEILIHGTGSCSKTSPLNISIDNVMVAQVASWFNTSNRIGIVKVKLIGGNIDTTDCFYGTSWTYFNRSFGAFKEGSYEDLSGSALLYIDGMSAGVDHINKGYKLKVWAR